MYTNNDLKKGKVNPQSIYFDGHCLDKEVPGYETISVAGRELFSPELKTLIVGNQDGDRLQQNRFPARDIKVTYQMQRRTAGELRESYHMLNAKLLGIKKKIWFEDEPELYYVGTLSDAEVPTAGMTKFQSTFTLHCNDPFAYAMREDSFDFSDKQQMLSVTASLAGKITYDLDSNPNAAYTAISADYAVMPSTLTREISQAQYTSLAAKDADKMSTSAKNNNAGIMIKFDVLKSIEKNNPGTWSKYGADTTMDQIDFLAVNMSNLTINVTGYGNPGINYQIWNGTEWVGLQTKSGNSLVTITDTFKTTDESMAYIDSGGYLYIMIYATSTTINTLYLDYAELKLTLALPASDTLTINNDGPMPVPIRFDLTNRGQNGFVGLSSGDRAILIGDQTQMDGGTVTKSERIFTTNHDLTKWDTQWTLNKGIINDMYVPNYSINGYIGPSEWNVNGKRWSARSNDFGTGSGWHGPTAHTDFLKDSADAVGAINFEARAYARFYAGNMNEFGIMDFVINNPGMQHLISVRLWKWGNVNANLDIRIGDHWVYQDWGNPRWNQFFGSIVMRRFGNTFTIVLDSSENHGTSQTVSYTINDDDNLSATDTHNENAKATGFTVWEGTFGDTPNSKCCDLTFLDFWITKHNVNSYTDVPNTFAGGDLISVTGDDGKVVTTVNGSKALGLQDIGSQPLLAYPGRNNINIGYSPFADRPDVTAYIRKKYL